MTAAQGQAIADEDLINWRDVHRRGGSLHGAELKLVGRGAD